MPVQTQVVGVMCWRVDQDQGGSGQVQNRTSHRADGMDAQDRGASRAATSRECARAVCRTGKPGSWVSTQREAKTRRFSKRSGTEAPSVLPCRLLSTGRHTPSLQR